MREVEVVGVRVEMPSNSPIVLLRESGGERYLPIWIGAVEATAIAFAQQGVVPPRPLTHDLLKDVIEATGNEVSEIRITEVFSDVTHDMGEAAALERDGVEAHLQELLAEQPHWCGEGLTLVKREWFTDIGPVDLMCRDPEENWVAVEIKRTGTIEAVEQISRYLERIRREPTMSGCRGVLAAQSIKPQARTLAEGRDIACVEVDLAVLRGEREPDLTLFG